MFSRPPIVLAAMLMFATVPFSGAHLSAGGAAQAIERPSADLIQLMLIPDIFDAMQEEGIEYGTVLAQEFLGGDADSVWKDKVENLYAPERLLPVFEDIFAADLAKSGVNTSALYDFFSSPLGVRIVRLELSARRTMLDDTVEKASRRTVEGMKARGDARIVLLQDYISANHLIDLNVASAMNASFAFYRGLASAGAIDRTMTEEDMLAQVWSQEADVRAETEQWMLTFSTVAYAPLTDDELRLYTAFSMTPEGVALNHALFAGFDAIFQKVSTDLGRAVGLRSQGTDI